MNRCVTCGLTAARLKSYWRQTRGVNNPGDCKKHWIKAGYCFNTRNPEDNPVKGCMSNELFGITGDPYHFSDASYDHARRSAGFETEFYSSRIEDEWIAQGKEL